MNGYSYIDIYGLYKAKRIVENVICDAVSYSEITGSYYSEDRNDTVNVKKLKLAIKEYEDLKLLEKKYKQKVLQWIKNSVDY